MKSDTHRGTPVPIPTLSLPRGRIGGGIKNSAIGFERLVVVRKDGEVTTTFARTLSAQVYRDGTIGCSRGGKSARISRSGNGKYGV